jgi:flagellar biosynthesis/type III secretory pathway protein FliH
LHKADKLKIKERVEQRAFDEENAEKIKKAIADGIAEGLRKARYTESTTVSTSKEENDK